MPANSGDASGSGSAGLPSGAYQVNCKCIPVKIGVDWGEGIKASAAELHQVYEEDRLAKQGAHKARFAYPGKGRADVTTHEEIRERVFQLFRNLDTRRSKPVHLLKAALLAILSREELAEDERKHRLECQDPDPDDKSTCIECDRAELERERVDELIFNVFVETEDFLIRNATPIQGYGKSPIQAAIDAARDVQPPNRPPVF